MAEKKSPFKKAKPAAKTSVKVLSDKEKVLAVYDDAECLEAKERFYIFDADGEKILSGLAKSESDAWKLAAHNL